MKTVIRAFFKTLRVVLGPFMLLKERLTQPRGVVRDVPHNGVEEKSGNPFIAPDVAKLSPEKIEKWHETYLLKLTVS